MEERGVAVDHATIPRGVVQDSPLLEVVFHRWKRSVWARWRMDETSIKVRLLLDSNSNFDFIRGLGLSIDTDFAKVETAEYQGGGHDDFLKL